MNMSPNINELITALSKAQGKIAPAVKDKKNPHFKSSYADLGSIWEACRAALSENGLAVVQTVESHDKQMVLVTTLAHSTGQWMRSEMPMIVQKMDPQGIGSALTYYRRYSLASIVGVAPEDDDAESAQNRKPVEVRQKQPDIAPQFISATQASDLYEKLLWCPIEYQQTIGEYCRKNNVGKDFSGLSMSLYERLKKAIDQKLTESKADLHDEPSMGQAVEA